MRVTKSTWVDVGSGSILDVINALKVTKVPGKANLVDVDYGVGIFVDFGNDQVTKAGVRFKYEWSEEE